MARRRQIELAPGVRPFERSVQQWWNLSAPEWVIDAGAATEKYVAWARHGYGREADPSDEVIRKYFVEMAWLKRCIRPQFLLHVGALNRAERELLAADRSARWGRPGRCWAQLLEAESAGLPRWLSCCERDPRSGAR